MSEKFTKKELLEFKDYYDEHIKKPVPREVLVAHKKMTEAFNDYLFALEEYDWINGFLYAVELAREGLIK